MARGHALFGKIQGRLGGAVYRIQDGKQVISEYRGTILNPKSEGQVYHRVKFGLATHVAALFPYANIAGFSPKPNIARSTFIKKILPLVQIDESQRDNPVAYIVPDNLVLSSGRIAPIVDCTAAISQNQLSIECRTTFDPSAKITHCQFQVLVVDNDNVTWLGVFSAIADVNNSTGLAEASVKIMDSREQYTGKVYVYAVPICDKTNYVATKYGDLTTIDHGSKLAADCAIALSQRNAYCQSRYIGMIPLQ